MKPSLLLLCACTALLPGFASAQDDLAKFWRPGQVRELFISGLPSEAPALADWAASGVNCVTGVKPELAHAAGLKTRTWFTMTYMDSRSTPEEQLKAMAAVHADGSYARPYDPLFPTVGQYGWTACVNNPLWIARSQGLFRKMAEDGYDGCHIDFASHYENCFCPHCRQRWAEWAPPHGLPNLDLTGASASTDLRVQMLLREFRIQCVMTFLKGLETAARAVKPGFANDGTWHHDSGSTYQWAYGDHFDLMCIEGTTWGPFPPASTQIPWLKLSQVLSRRPDREPVAMSVTYHLLPDANGTIHHGRMAADRVRVTLGEIISEGAVSWLGLGGPSTGNLLKEHQELVKAYFRTARDLQPALVGAREIAAVGLLFSPKSYLLSDSPRTQLYAFAQMLMRRHIPYRIVSDVGLKVGDLTDLPALVVLDGRALSDEACTAVDQYVRGGGQTLAIGADVATLTQSWQPRLNRPAFAVAPETKDLLTSRDLGRGKARFWLQKLFEVKRLGASQYVPLNPDKPVKLAIEGWSKAENVSGGRDSNYSLYVDLTRADGSNLWGQVATFDTGTHDWKFSRTIISDDKPLKGANVHLLFRGHGGTAWFKDVRFGVWDEGKQQIVQNLLGNRYQDAAGKVFGDATAGGTPGAVWVPYGDGYQLENMLEQGWWVKTSAARGLDVGPMNQPDPVNEGPTFEALKPLCPSRPYLEITGRGAELVCANLTRNGRQVALHLINYAAELRPDLPELEQQAQEHSLPARDLVIAVRVPGLKLRADSGKLHSPEGQPSATFRALPDGVEVRLSELRQYAALTWEVQ
jgi:hypothetical protein